MMRKRVDVMSDSSTPRSVVTGGAGFVGSHLVDLLLDSGHRVVAIDNLVTGNIDNIAHLAGESQFEYREQDICKPFTIEGEVNYIYNMASPASPMDYLELPMETMYTGSYGTHNMLEMAREKGASFLMASTSEVYGDPLVHPQEENYWGNVNPIGPRSVYDEAKRFSETLTMAYHVNHRVNTHIVRIFNTYGPRMRPNDGRVVPAFATQALKGEALTIFGDGSQTRSFCYVSDLVRGIHLLAESGHHTPVNIGNPRELTVKEFAETIRDLCESSSEYEYRPLPQDDPKIRRPNIEKAQELLGWFPEMDLEEGLRLTIEYFRGLIDQGVV